MSFDVFDVSASGMYAQRLKMDTISSNVANINTTRKEDGSQGVYVKKEVSFKAIYDDKMKSSSPSFPNGFHKASLNASGDMTLTGGISYNEGGGLSQGVAIADISDSKNPYKTVYDPSHPDSDVNGYVTLPNINIVEEMVGMISASRAYEANATAAETTKSMVQSALRI